jgi:exonuclease III
LPGDATDPQSRYLEAAINGVVVASIYAPNGNPQPGPKFEYKLAWLKRLAAHAADLYASGAPVVLAGDYNVVPTDLDIYPTKSWGRDALLQPESRGAYQRLLSQGWSDAIRALHPQEPMYTFFLDIHRHQVSVEHRRRFYQLLAECHRWELERQSPRLEHATLHRFCEAPKRPVAGDDASRGHCHALPDLRSVWRLDSQSDAENQLCRLPLPA